MLRFVTILTAVVAHMIGAASLPDFGSVPLDGPTFAVAPALA